LKTDTEHGGSTMKIASVATAFLFAICLAMLSACDGDGDGDAAQEEPILIEDAEAVALQVGDLPVDFVAEGEPAHLTNEQTCAASGDAERQECIDRLEGFGRRDNYQVAYYATDPTAILFRLNHVFSSVSVYETATGAAQAFDYSQGKLEQAIRTSEDISRVSAPTVGDESAAFVANLSAAAAGGAVSISSYVVDFRRGNLLVRVGTDVPATLGNVDDAVQLARQVDQRILRVASLISPTASPIATP
jgi:hypothetical protein